MPVYTKLFIAFFFMVFFAYYFMQNLFSKHKAFSNNLSNLFLLLCSIIFYAWSEARYVPFLLGVGLVCYLSIFINSVKGTRRILITAAIIVMEIFPLILNRIMLLPAIRSSVRVFGPLGLSFFTMQAITYTVSVYQNKLKPEKNPITILLFVAFFPSVTSGPILRADRMIPQFRDANEFDYNKAANGFKQMAFGLFKKLVIADNLAVYISAVRSSEAPYGTALLLAAVLYSFQLYLDFSGYSDIVIGCGRALGYDLGTNFDHPYLSSSIGEFWNRWHISLSSWLKDYIYIPLGGSRKGSFRTFFNTLITFAISGIWHGVGLTWLIWGLYHGALVYLERLLGVRKKASSAFRIIVVFILVTIGWIIFSADSMQAVAMSFRLFTHIPSEFMTVLPDMIHEENSVFTALLTLVMVPEGASYISTMAFLVLFIIISIRTGKVSGFEIIKSKPGVVRWMAYITFVLVILLFGSTNNGEFIYSRF